MDIDNQDESDVMLKQWKPADLTAKIPPEIPQENTPLLKKKKKEKKADT